jgi:ribonuclease/clavin/mitogillin
MSAELRPKPVAPDVEGFGARTPTLAPATHTQSYAMGSRQVLLVEPATPYDDERREWLAWARGLASAGRELVAVFATHHHPDHVGGAEHLSRELGLPVWGHELTAERVPDVAWGRTLSEGDTVTLDGPRPMRLEVLHTPGHAVGHLCLFDREAGTVVVGDMVASVGTILIEPHEGDMGEYLRQLRRLAGLGAKVALAAHGDPIHEPTALFEHYVAHRLRREALVAEALRAAGSEGATLSELVPRAYADTAPAVWPIARISLEAHLVELGRQGRAQRVGAERWSTPSRP